MAAHFGFNPDLPPHALAVGADTVVTSAHKALPASTEGALVVARARTDRLDPARLDRAFDSTSSCPAGPARLRIRGVQGEATGFPSVWSWGEPAAPLATADSD
jgi:hypothetical protein